MLVTIYSVDHISSLAAPNFRSLFSERGFALFLLSMYVQPGCFTLFYNADNNTLYDKLMCIPPYFSIKLARKYQVRYDVGENNFHGKLYP